MGRTGRGRGACNEASRFTTLRGVVAAVLGGAAVLATTTVALAAPVAPDPEPEPDPAPVAAVQPQHAPSDDPLVGKVAVVKWIEGVPTPWPVTLTILGDSGATFADGSTSTDVVTNASGEPRELTIVGVPTAGVRVRLQEPDRSDATFQDVVCESYGSGYPTESIERGVEVVVPPLAEQPDGESWGWWRPFPVCWFENVPATRITVQSRLDGGTPPTGASVAVVPEIGRVGSGGVFSADGLFPAGTGALPVELTGLREWEPTNVFVGQTTVTGTTLYDMNCTVGESTYGGPLQSRTIGGQTIVGITIPITPRDEVACSVDAANADLRAEKTASIASAGPGAVFDYTIVATNRGRAPLFAAAVTDAVPSQLTVLGVQADETSTACTATGNQVECTLGDLPAGAVRTIRVTVSVHDDVVDASTITNVAIVRGEVPLWVPGLGTSKPADGASVAPAADRPPVFARAVQVLATNVVRAFAPPPAAPATTAPASTAPATTATTASSPTVPTTAPATTAPATATPTTATPTTASVAQQGPLPTVSGGTTLPSTGSDLSLLDWASWTVAIGVALVAIRRLRRPAPR